MSCYIDTVEPRAAVSQTSQLRKLLSNQLLHVEDKSCLVVCKRVCLEYRQGVIESFPLITLSNFLLQ